MREIKNDELFWARANESVIIPTKESENGGYDIYANFEEDYITIEPHETKMIPTNLACAFSEDFAMILKERGSTGTKGIGQRCGVIDSGYRNLIFVPVTNTNNKVLIIAKDIELAKQEIELQLSNQSLDTSTYTTTTIDGHVLEVSNSGEIVKLPPHYHGVTIINEEPKTIDDYIFYPYNKGIAQAIMVEVPKLKSQEIPLDELQAIPSKRGMGNLGSSGK